MTFSEYQEQAATTAIYPPDLGLEYTALALAGEAGEVAQAVSKHVRDDLGDDQSKAQPWSTRVEGLAKELGDCIWCIAMVATELELSLDDIVEANLKKLADRQVRGQLGGSGDSR